MTAQQQLVSILASRDETGHVPATAVDFIRDHGPALVELIEAAKDRRKAESEWFYYEVSGESEEPYNPAEGARLEQVRDAAVDRENAALKSLTEPK